MTCVKIHTHAFNLSGVSLSEMITYRKNKNDPGAELSQKSSTNLGKIKLTLIICCTEIPLLCSKRVI